LITIIDSLRSNGDLERSGGAGNISSLTDGIPSIFNVPHYAAIVRNKSRLRNLIHWSESLKQRAFSEENDAEQLIESAISEILSIADDDGGLVEARPWKEVAASAMGEVERAMLNPEQVRRIHFGLADLDDMTGGLYPKEVVSIVSQTSHGKTLLAAQAAFQADQDGFKVLIFSAEMRAEDIALREIAYKAGVKFYFVRRPEKLTSAEYERLVVASEREHSLQIVDRDVTPLRIWAMAEAAKRNYGLDLVIVDYDQLVIEAGINPDSDDDNVFRQQRAFMFSAKKLAERLDINFMLLSQVRKLSPTVLKGAQPHLDDVWGDSSVRNTPQVILWLCRDFLIHGLDKRYERMAKVYVLKSRNSCTGLVSLEFDPEMVRFTDQVSDEGKSTSHTTTDREREIESDN